MGASVALPFLEAMVPARSVVAARRVESPGPTRLVAIEMVHGSAGSNEVGLDPEPVVASGDRQGLRSEPQRDELRSNRFGIYLTIVSDTDVRHAEAVIPEEIGGDHFRSSAVFLTQEHPKQTESSDVYAGTSPRPDVRAALRSGQTPIPSMQLCIENVDQAGGCAYGYSCVYTDTISWASPTEPLPMIRDPRVVFDQLFGSGGTARRACDASAHRPQHPRLRARRGFPAEAASSMPPTRGAWTATWTNIRELERRIQKIVEAQRERRDA